MGAEFGDRIRSAVLHLANTVAMQERGSQPQGWS
jgi:hypothetical protein